MDDKDVKVVMDDLFAECDRADAEAQAALARTRRWLRAMDVFSVAVVVLAVLAAVTLAVLWLKGT